MQKTPLMIIALTLLSSCNSRKESAPTPKLVEAKAVTSVNKDCEVLGFSHPEAMANWKMDNGKELVVCNYNEAQKISDNEFSGWINLLEKKGGSIAPFIPEVDSELPSEFYSFTIKKIDGTKVVIQRLIKSSMTDDGGHNSVATETSLECTNEDCKLGPEKCINLSSYKIDKEAVQNLLDIRFKKRPAKDYGYLDVLIGKVVNSALAGDKQALLALEGDGTDKNGLSADGAAAEELTDGLYLIRQFIKLGCIKK